MSTGIELDTVFSGSGLINTKPLGQQLLAHAGVGHWWQFDPSYATLSGDKITSLSSRKAPGVMAQATDANRPLMLPNRVGGYSAGVFDGAASRLQFSASGGTPPVFSGAFSMVCLFKAEATATGSQQVVTNYAGVNVGTLLSVVSAADTARFVHGNGQATVPYTRGTWALAVAVSDATTIGIEVNGNQSARVATNNAFAPTPGLVFGALASNGSQFLTGEIAEVIILPGLDLWASPNAALLNLCRTYAKRVYGVGA